MRSRALATGESLGLGSFFCAFLAFLLGHGYLLFVARLYGNPLERDGLLVKDMPFLAKSRRFALKVFVSANPGEPILAGGTGCRIGTFLQRQNQRHNFRWVVAFFPEVAGCGN